MSGGLRPVREAPPGPGGAECVAHPAGTAAPVRPAAWVRYRKQDVFEICAALALAEAVLRRSGREPEAARMAAAFELAEAGLAR